MVGPNFIGHFLPGAFLFLLALFWLVRLGALVWRRRNGSKSALPGGLYYCSGITRPTTRGLPVVSFVQAALPIVLSMRGARRFPSFSASPNARSAELYMTGFNIWPDTMQHLTMYCSFFLLAGCHIGVWISKRWGRDLVPEALLQLGSAIPMLVIGMLFTFHLSGRWPLDVRIHTLLYYCAFAAATLHILEMWRPNWELLVLLRIFCYFQLGEWLVAIGALLEGLPYDASPGPATVLFACLLMLNCVLIIGLFVGAYAIGRWTQKMDPVAWQAEKDAPDDGGVALEELALLEE